MKYLKITLLWKKRALFGQILQGAMSDYGALISFGLFLGIVVENVEILLESSTKIYYLTLVLSFFKFIFRFYHLYIYIYIHIYSVLKTLLPIPENLGLKKLCRHDSL